LSNLKASIIVAVYNGAKTLEACINSLLAQTYSNFEILLVDDGSSDNSYEVIQAFESDPRVRYFKKENGGVASARNYGIGVSEGDVIGFCDQDDQWKPTKLEKQLPRFDDPDVGLVYSWVEIQRMGETDYSKPEIEGRCFHELLDVNFISCCTALVRKSILKDIGGFDDSRELHGVDDRHVWLRVARISKLAVVKEPLAVYYIHGENYSMNQMKMLIADLVCVRKIAAMPEVSEAEREECRQAEHKIYLHYAGNLFYQNKPDLAGQCYLDAWKIKPLKVQLLIKGIGLKLMPASLLKKAKAARKSVKRAA